VVHRRGEQEVIAADDRDGESYGQRQVAGRIPCLTAGLGNRVETDEAGEQQRRCREKQFPVQLRDLVQRDCAPVLRLQRLAEICMVVGEAGYDHNCS
jgi:hypothetical protein